MPLVGECCWGLVAEGLVWPVVVVVVSPVFEEDLGFVEGVEGLDVGVLPGGSGFDVVGSGAGVAAPVAECFGDEFGPVVAADVGRCAPSGLDQALEDGNGLVGVDRAGRDAGERLAGVFVGDVEDLDRPAISSGIKDV